MTAPALTDPTDLATLYRDHGGAIFRFLLRRCGRRDLAEDLTQDTFVRFARWSAGHTWTDRGRSLLAFLYTIARSVIADHRKRGYQREVPTDTFFDAGSTLDGPEQQVVTRSEAVHARQVLHRALATLPPRQQQVVWLVHVHGLSTREVGDQLDMTDAAVKAATYRAVRNLRRWHHTVQPLRSP